MSHTTPKNDSVKCIEYKIPQTRGKFSDIVIVSDLDGTFLGTKSRLIEKNLEAIKYFQENGGFFTLATGRCIKALQIVLPDVGNIVNAPAILSNGAYIYDFKSNTIYYPTVMEFHKTIAILQDIMEKFPNIGFRTSADSGFLVPDLNPYLAEELKNYLSITTEIALDKIPYQNLYKTVFAARPEELLPLKEYLKEKIDDDYVVTTSSPKLVEIMNSNATKGEKIKILKTLFENENIKTIAMGDYENDIAMLKSADYAACPDNALDSVKEICDIKLCNNNDGAVADLISKIEQNGLPNKF